MKHWRFLIGTAALLLATQPGCKKFKEAQAKAAEKRAEEKAQAATTLATLPQQLAAIRTHLSATPSSELREKRCPEAAILASVDPKKNFGKARLATLTGASLDQLVDRGAVTWDPSDKLGFLTSALPGGLKLGATGYNDNEYRVTEMRKDSGHYLGIYRDVKSEPPRVVEKAGTFTGDNVFDGGTFDAWLVVYDTETAQPVCATHIAAKNSDKVKWRDRGIAKTTFDKALSDDFVSEVKRQAEAGMKRIGPKVTLGM